MTSLGLRAIRLEDDADAWRSAGFDVARDGAVHLSGLRVELERDDATGWSWWSDEDRTGDIDAIVTTWVTEPPPPAAAHPIGRIGVDHVVLRSPDLDRTTSAFEGLGIACRRVRDVGSDEKPFQQRFFRVGPVILELVGDPSSSSEGPASIWGLALTVDDLDTAVARLGPACGRAKDAVQPGRRIATVRTTDLGISLPVALMSPDPRRSRS